MPPPALRAQGAPGFPHAPALLLALAAVMGVLSLLPARAEVIEEIVARVNDDIITMTQLRERESRIMSELFQRFSGEELEQRVKAARAGLLRDLVRESMLLQRAETLGLDTTKIVDVGLEQIKRQNEIKTNEELLRTLREQGTTLEELREQILRFNVPPLLIDREVRQKVAVSEKEIAEYYDKHKEEFLIPESVTFREIVLRLGEEVDAEAQRARAEEVAAELAGGAQFEALVEKYSEAPSREVGGKVGPLAPGELARAIERALRELSPGQTSPVVESRYGFHILRLEERVAERQRELAEVRSDIEEKLRDERTDAAVEAYFDKLTKENFVQISPAYERYKER